MSKKKEQAIYQITVTERQLKLINTALEEFFRIGLNQWGDLADRVANIGFEYPPKDAENRELVFDRHIHTRDAVRTVLETAGRILETNFLPKYHSVMEAVVITPLVL